MAQLTDISDVAALSLTLHRTANMVKHLAEMCEQKDVVIADRDTTIIALQRKVEENSSNERKRKK